MEWGWLRQTLEECGPFPWLSSAARCPLCVPFQVPYLVVGMPSPFTQVCSMKDNRRKGIHPRAGFGSPGRCEGGRKRHSALQPPSFSLGEGLVRSNPTCCVFIHGYLPIPGRRMSSGSSLPPSFPAPCHPQTATVWLGLCPEGWHLMRGLHRTLSPTAKSTPEGGTFSQQPCYDYLGDSAPI